MKHKKTCSSAAFTLLLAIIISGCGNKGPLTFPESESTDTKSVETTLPAIGTEPEELKK